MPVPTTSVLNGVELGGGSIRISDPDIQQKMFEAIGLTDEQAAERFGFLLNAFKYGVPPHGGMAYGLDRLVMLMLGKDSIKEVIAFPKVQNASDLMTDCPSVGGSEGPGCAAHPDPGRKVSPFYAQKSLCLFPGRGIFISYQRKKIPRNTPGNFLGAGQLVRAGIRSMRTNSSSR